MTRLRLAAGGLFAVALLVATAITGVAYSAGVFDDDPAVTVRVPASAGQLKERSPVQYRGVVVGTVTTVAPGARESVLTLSLSPETLPTIPASARARILPRTLFGDTYVDLAASADAPGSGSLTDGTVVPHDDSAETAQLYTVGRRLYSLVTEIQPAKVSATLAAVADALRGKGPELGRLIDEASAFSAEAGPLTDTLLAELPELTGLTDELAVAAPDLFRALDNATVISDEFVRRGDDLRRLLAAGTRDAALADSFLRDNADRTITLVDNTSRVLETVAGHPGATGDIVQNLDKTLGAVTQALTGGPWLKLRASLTFDDPFPYTARDCPRYGELAGPNCDDPVPQGSEPTAPAEAAPTAAPPIGGNVGPVGSAQELDTIDRLMPPPAAGRDPGPLGFLLGPLLRGTKVVEPR